MPFEDKPEAITNLRDWDDFAAKRKDLYEDVREEVSRSFPISYGGTRIELTDVDYADPEEFDMTAQKKAILENRSLSRRLRGTLSLIDEATGQPLDKKTLTLMRVPYLTDRGTFVQNGADIASIAQARLLPGVYTRRQESGELESMINTKPGTGPGFRVGFEPDTAQYRLRLRGANLHLYSLFRDLGITDEELAQKWGPDILKMNAGKYDSRVLDKAYGYLVPKAEQVPEADRETKARQVREAMDRARVHGSVLRRNLPNALDPSVGGQWKQAAAALAVEPFEPDLSPADVREERGDIEEKAAEEFDPDLTAEELGDEYANLYMKHGPRLAGMKCWPVRWFAGDERGWLDWYQAYASGRRGPDDEWQMNRWKRFKGKHVAAFLKNPTPRRGISLRQWGIDPLKQLPEKDRPAFEQAMKDYRAGVFRDGLEKVAAEASGTYELKEAGEGGKGCLMAYLSDPEAHMVLEWRETNIPESDIVEPEQSPHATIVYGFGPDVTAEQVFKVIKDAGIGPLKVTLGNLDRFPAHEGRPESDVLWISFTKDQDLRDLRELLLSKFDAPQSWPDYTPHVCVCYISPGSVKELDGHGRFFEEKLRITKLVYSEAGSKKKTILNLGE